MTHAHFSKYPISDLSHPKVAGIAGQWGAGFARLIYTEDDIVSKSKGSTEPHSRLKDDQLRGLYSFLSTCFEINCAKNCNRKLNECVVLPCYYEYRLFDC